MRSDLRPRARMLSIAAAVVPASIVLLLAACGGAGAPSDPPDASAPPDVDANPAPAEDEYEYETTTGRCEVRWSTSPTEGRVAGPLAVVADLDDDGVADVAIPSNTADHVVLELRSGATGEVIRTIAVAGSVLSLSSPLGDLDGDEHTELALATSEVETSGGDPRNAPPSSLHMMSPRTGEVLWTRRGPDGEASFATAVVATRNLDDDARPDLVVSSVFPKDEDGQSLTGRVYLAAGRDGATVAPLSAPGDAGPGYGTALATGMARDGTPRLLIGDPTAAASRGAVYAHGASDHALLWTYAFQPGDEVAGGRVVNVGDLDGDQTPDLAVAAPGRGGTGAIDVVSGDLGAARWSAAGRRDAEAFGLAIASTTDLDGDGVSEIVVAAPAPGIPPVLGLSARIAIVAGADGATLVDVEERIDDDVRSTGFGTGVGVLGTADGAVDLVATAPRSGTGGVVVLLRCAP